MTVGTVVGTGACQVLTLLAWLLLPGNSFAQADEPSQVDTYVPPVRVQAGKLVYPTLARQTGAEAWVELNYMVGTNGKAYEIVVTDAVGSSDFQRAAIRAIEASTFRPAAYAGTPIDAASRFRYTFALTGDEDGVRSVFSSQYRNLRRHIETEQRDKAEATLGRMRAFNLYEDAILNLGRYWFEFTWGTPEAALQAITRATQIDDSMTLLPPEFRRVAMRSRFHAEVTAAHFGAALKTARAMEKLHASGELEIDADSRASLDKGIHDLENLRRDDAAFAVEGLIGESSNWDYALLKDEMAIDVHSGEIAELKLRCERRYVGFRFVADSTFRIPESFGTCDLEVIGNPGTRFTLTQM